MKRGALVGVAAWASVSAACGGDAGPSREAAVGVEQRDEAATIVSLTCRRGEPRGTLRRRAPSRRPVLDVPSLYAKWRADTSDTICETYSTGHWLTPNVAVSVDSRT